MYLFNYVDPYSHKLITTLIVIGLLWLTKWLLETIKSIRSLPPGPWGYPIVGYLPLIKQHLYLELDKLSSKYGPVFSIKLGQENIVVICDWPHMKEAFANEALLARPDTVFFPGIIDARSFVEMSGDIWRVHRRLSLQILRNVGLGKNVLESAIKEEIQSFLTTLDTGGKSVNFLEKLSPSVSNNISLLLFGHKFDYDDRVKKGLDNSIEVVGREFSFAGIFAFLPWLARLLVSLGAFKLDKVKKALLYFESYVQTEIDSHEAKESKEIVDYIDGYMEEKKKREKTSENLLPKDGKDSDFSYDILRRNCFAFFGAGFETIQSTMTWAVTYLIQYPEFQDKIQSEIQEVIGYERGPDYSDRNRMPFTLAFLYEVHRHASIVALNLFRKASRETTIGSFKIPKDTPVLFNFWSVHYDPKLWTEPDKFDPTRFLVDGGSKAVKPPYLVPFSGGKRICPGEGLANVEAFLYLVSILQQFTIKLEPGTQLTSEISFGISRRPTQLVNIIFERRNSQP